MANYLSSPQVNGHPLSDSFVEINALSAVVFGTGAINTAVIGGLAGYSKRMLYIDITGAFTGGMSAPVTFLVQSKPDTYGIWTTWHTYSLTNTAYVFTLNPTGVSLSGHWCPAENLRITVTNPNTGTGAGITAVTATINLAISASR